MTASWARRARSLWIPALLAGCAELPSFVPLRDLGVVGLDAATLDADRADAGAADAGADGMHPTDARADDAPLDEGPRVERCNGRDDDDDGAIDEAASPMTPCLSGEGRCAIDGMQLCQQGELRCIGTFVAASREICNGEDDDCDGMSDEGFTVGQPCVAGEGQCARDGWLTCLDDGSAGCDGVPHDEARTDEVCDGLDNDCDGVTDEAEGSAGPLAEACDDLDQQGECRRGERICLAEPAAGVERWSACESVVIPAASDLCDGLDNDCDGSTDNGFAIGQPCDIPLPEGGLCPQRGVFHCTADGFARECRPRPETECNGIDDNCDGVIDDGPACAELITRECRAWLGWTTRELDNPSDTWGTCPAAPELAADLSCDGSGPGDALGQLELFGDLDAADDRLGVRFGCRNGAGSLVDYIAAHCALYLGVATADNAPPDGAEAWATCPAEPVGGDRDAACTSGDARFRPMPLPFDLDEGAVLGAAFRCVDPLQPRRAEAMAGAVEIVIGWADSTLGEPAPD